ncbi:MAG: tRNA (adenosine(37)-N6)-threonylcarbamoyltransferase complex ATPase subunit type 1 TsaE [Rhizobiales bacterium]|nr:tRNA (adenosine(37)-N6)-threonylcarbamoyltransferase complex ATPase subunit type 1 TsaE [Hyphomicrobiales bacterium]
MSVSRALPTAEATERLGHEIALVARPGTAILLEGELGAGKTTLARAIIRSLSGGTETEVPSPTFTLVQTYEDGRMPVAHADLYRIGDGSEVGELGLTDLARTHLLIIEWPDRLPAPLFEDVLTIRLDGMGESRRAVLHASGAWVQALDRLESIAKFLPRAGFGEAKRNFLEGDASFRRYERLDRGGQSFVLMDMAARPDGPPVKNGKPYSAIAHLAEDIRAVLAVNGYLESLGYSAPHTYAHDTVCGLAVIEDLGSQVYGRMMLAGADMSEPMATAILLLADMAERDWPDHVPVPGGGTHPVPLYDREALSIETELLLDWYWPFLTGREVPRPDRESFCEVWSEFLPLTQPTDRTWVLRDFHSPNLLWLPEREGLRRVGLIDTQDCVLGHPAYDVAALLRDARVDVPFDVAEDLLEYYCAAREPDPQFDKNEFRRAFALLSVQRATKILGIFARLSRRDGKHGYIRHMPRVSRYLERDLAHPDLARLRDWYDRHLPANLRASAA